MRFHIDFEPIGFRGTEKYNGALSNTMAEAQKGGNGKYAQRVYENDGECKAVLQRNRRSFALAANFVLTDRYGGVACGVESLHFAPLWPVYY